MRIYHVIDKFLHQKENKIIEKKDIGVLVADIVADVKKESYDEIVWSDSVVKVIKKKAGLFIKQILDKQKFDNN